jgi:hypothetical protein
MNAEQPNVSVETYETVGSLHLLRHLDLLRLTLAGKELLLLHCLYIFSLGYELVCVPFVYDCCNFL